MYSRPLTRKSPLSTPIATAIVLAVLVLAVSLARVLNPLSMTSEQEHTHKIALGWIPYWDQQQAIASFKENIDLFSDISLFWYTLDDRGRVRKYREAEEDRAILEYAQARGVKVLAIVTNLPDDEEETASNWDPERVWRVIKSSDSRERHVTKLLGLVNRLGFDGINIDYESLPGEYRSEFTEFIKLLGFRLHEQGKILAVALHPKTSEDDPWEDNGSHAQDWEALHPYVDQMHFMTYGEHGSGDPPGPVASYGWVESILRYAIEARAVPREKIFLGLPLYAEIWEKVGSNQYRGIDSEYTFREIESISREYNAEVKWDESSLSPYFSFSDESGKQYVIWFENAASLSRKLSLGQSLGIGKIALWRLGEEDARVWEAIRDSLH